jgi:aconitate hydratase
MINMLLFLIKKNLNYFNKLKHLRQIGVVNKFVEFFGPGVAQLSIADRATIANMCPEYGATIGYFPADQKAIQYLVQTGRNKNTIRYIEEYLKAVKLFRDYNDELKNEPVYSQVYEMDLSNVMPCVSGPKRPQDKIFVADLTKEFKLSLTNKVGFNVRSFFKFIYKANSNCSDL